MGEKGLQLKDSLGKEMTLVETELVLDNLIENYQDLDFELNIVND